ncbi:tetratricopeptide repeat protein [Chryseolinea sp. H1M3-3]|uniref:tetratricopeptide repeat protein n=1 Tax=Chryseolinea sp. H1M3-3 TaxID=3034144 RepID=UPI0023EDCAA0|nr:tetratricopeptide repeat protein [Chryseolinea sp. H1M3-3]
MKPTEHDITLMERYFDSELSVTELEHFHSRVATDATFKALVQREKILIGAIRNQGLLDNLQYLKAIEDKIQGNQAHPASPKIQRWYYYAAAAVVTILLSVTFLLPTQKSSDELFAEYFTTYPNFVEPTTRGSNEATNRAEAFQAYEQKDYQKAAALFTKMLNENRESGVLLLLGNSNLMLGKTKEAKENFVTLIEEFDELDIQAKWYLSLCYLKSGDTENARKILKELGETEVSYASKAKELLEQVD